MAAELHRRAVAPIRPMSAFLMMASPEGLVVEHRMRSFEITAGPLFRDESVRAPEAIDGLVHRRRPPQSPSAVNSVPRVCQGTLASASRWYRRPLPRRSGPRRAIPGMKGSDRARPPLA